MSYQITTVPKNLATPEGATHFTCGYFDKVQDGKVYRWWNNQWQEFTPGPLTSIKQYIASLAPIRTYEIADDAKRVMTPHGMGTVVGPDYSRLLIDLDSNPFSFRPAAYYSEELQFVD